MTTIFSNSFSVCLLNIFMQCDRQRALSTYFHQMKTPPIKVGWIGSGCSPATEPTAELSYFYNITQVNNTLY